MLEKDAEWMSSGWERWNHSVSYVCIAFERWVSVMRMCEEEVVGEDV